MHAPQRGDGAVQAPLESNVIVNPLWPTLFAVAGILLVIRGVLSKRKSPDRSVATRLFLLVASCLIIVAGFADIAARLVTIGKW